MPWFRLDDSFHSHPKVMTAGNEAVGLYVRCGTYAAQHLTDGFIPQQIALLYGSEALADALVQAKLWRRTRGGWHMPDYLDYNPSAEQVKQERKGAAERQRRRRDAMMSRRDSHVTNAVSHTTPTRPDPGSVVDVVDPVTGGNARAPNLIETIKQTIKDRTGTAVDDDWAQKIAGHILDSGSPRNPVAYVRSVIENDPDPRHRFLPNGGRP